MWKPVQSYMVVRILNFSLLVCLVPYVWMNLTLTHDNRKYLQHNRGLLKRLLIPHHIDYHALTTPEMVFPSNEYWQATWQWKARRAFLNLCRISHTSKRKRCQITQTFGNLSRYPRSIWDCCHDLVVLMQFLGTQSNWVNVVVKSRSYTLQRGQGGTNHASPWYMINGTWWRHQMETFSALLAIYAGNSPVPGEFPAQRPVTRNFDVFFDLRLNKLLSKQSWGWWFEMASRPLWCHRRGILS